MRRWGTLEKLGLAAYQEEDKGPEVESKSPSSCAQETLFSVTEAVAWRLECATIEGATMLLITGRKKRLLRGSKFLRFPKKDVVKEYP